MLAHLLERICWSIQQPYANDAEWIATMDASQYGGTGITTVEQLSGSDTLFTIADDSGYFPGKVTWAYR